MFVYQGDGSYRQCSYQVARHRQQSLLACPLAIPAKAVIDSC